MSGLLNVFGSFTAWWQEALTKLGAQLIEAQGGAALQAPADEDDPDFDREAWEQERARLALMPWWM